MVPLEVDQLLAPGTTNDLDEPGVLPTDVAAFVGEGTAFWIEDRSDLAEKRLIGCLLVRAMPADGLEETLNWLVETCEFYASAPEPDHYLIEAQKTSVISGQLMPAKARPPFTINE